MKLYDNVRTIKTYPLMQYYDVGATVTEISVTGQNGPTNSKLHTLPC